MSSTAIEDARLGNPEAITALINRSIQKKGISASIELEDGELDVMLDARQIPPESAGDFIFKGLQKLNIESVYDINVYGRKVGEPFATWCHRYELKPRPFGLMRSSARKSERTGSADGLTIQLSGGGSETIKLDIAQALGIAGIVLTILGIFSPVMTMPVVGTLNYFRNGTAEAIILIILTVFSVFFLLKKHYSWLYGSSVWALFLVSGTFLYYQSVFSDMKASVDRELSGNPFRGLADLAMAGTGLSWG